MIDARKDPDFPRPDFCLKPIHGGLGPEVTEYGRQSFHIVLRQIGYRSRPFLFVPLCTLSCGQKDEIGDFLRFRNKGDVTSVDFDRLGFHSIRKETLQFRRGRLVLF